MRLILLGLVFFSLLPSAASAQQQTKVTLKSGGLGKIAVSKGKLRSAAIDLTQEVVGCAYVAGSQKHSLDARGCASPPANFRLIDATATAAANGKQNQTFLVVLADAMGNCNVCGQCGASEALTLIWIRLDARLRVLEKKAVPIESCMEGVSLISPANEADDAETSDVLKLPFVSDVLTIEFEKTIYGENDTTSYEFSRLTYNRKTPEKGFDIKTEKRTKAANGN